MIDLKEEMCELIADYENSKSISEEERCTEYDEILGIYVFKMEISRGKINERYSEAKEAKEGKYVSNGKKITAIFCITLGHNVTDTASYSLREEDILIQNFLNRISPEKKIGVKIGDEKYYLLRKEENKATELLTLPFHVDTRYLERLDEIRSRWLKKVLEIERTRTKQQIEEIIQAGVKTVSKQPKFDYYKEINRRMKVNKKVFMEERMEGYDFREVDLSGAFFLNCSIVNSNFSGANLENALFVHCEMKDCMFYGAMLNNCRVYYGGTMLNLEDKTRKMV